MKLMQLFIFGAAVLCSGCASSKTNVVKAPVGPAPGQQVESMHSGVLQVYAPKGNLEVFSETDTIQDGDNTYYYPHTGYSICDQTGKRIKYIPNHVGDMDQSPSVVTIPAGSYKIVANSSSYGRVTVPVVIKGGRTTIVHLENDWKPSSTFSNQLVYLPDGETIGWKISK